MAYTQDGRPIGVETPLGKDELLLTSFDGEERISGLFRFQLNLMADESKSLVKPDEIVGKQVSFWIEHPDGKKRWFNGHVSQFAYHGTGDRGHLYTAIVVPWLWLLTTSSDCRVYVTDASGKTAEDVVKEVFTLFGFSDHQWQLTRKLALRDYCIQYQETHFDFVCRLLEEEGIYYWFKHEKGKHTLMLGDDKGQAETCEVNGAVTMASNDAFHESTDEINSWNHQYQFTTGKWAHTDYNFEQPTGDMEAKEKTVVKTTGVSKFERYEDNGRFANVGDGRTLAKLRIEQEEAGYNIVSGESVCRDFSPGLSFEVEDHHQTTEAGKWLLTRVTHHAELGGGFVSGGPPSSDIYSNDFSCIPADVQFRPARVTPCPRIHGIQTAVVVGPAGEEIHTDNHGRVKVQFHWDRKGLSDEKSSFWVRVAHPWTGSGWGMHAIPRIGQEVVIDFINGDPDRPLLTGMLFNTATPPPYPLPDEKTKSGVKTQSTPGGSSSDFNELRFEDKIGSEEIYLHAERDLNCIIENNETRKVGFDKTKDGDQTIEVFNNRSLTLEKGNETITLNTGNQTTTLKKGNQTTKIEKGNQTTEVATGNQTTTIKMGNQTTQVKMGKASYEAMQSIELKVGGNSIKVDQSGITIKGIQVKIQGDVMAKVQAPLTEVNGDATLILKGGVTMIN